MSAAPVVWRPSRELAADANVTRLMERHGLGSLDELRRWSVGDVGRFWDAVVDDLGIPFSRPYSRVLDASDGAAWARWFIDGEINVSSVCVDEPARRHPRRCALITETEDGQVETLTYAELASAVSAAAALLRQYGIGKGDAVAIFLPPCAEAVIAAYAIARLGALYVPMFSGFGVGALGVRLLDAGVRLVITADAMLRRGTARPLKPILDEALLNCPRVERVLVVHRLGVEVAMRPGRDVKWTLAQETDHAEAESTASEDPFMLIYTSGTTGRPKGAVHVHGGFLVKVAAEAAYQTDLRAGDVACWLTDMGWLMGPWMMLGCHSRGATMMLYDGAPDTPDPNRIWDLVGRHSLSILGVSPTLVRALIAAGTSVEGRDLSSLRLLASAGEPWNGAPYRWLHEAVGSRLPIINFSGGTEVGACFLSCHPVEPIKECSLGGAALGMDVDVLDPAGVSVRDGVGELVCRQPWPGMTRGLWQNREGYLATYWSTYEGLWCHGDWAMVDADGAWFLLGRSDDVLNIAGKRVGPTEVESILVSHPAVSEAAAVGVPDPVKGEAIWCFCVPMGVVAPVPTVVDELRALVIRELGPPFAPSRIAFVEALPHTRSAKIVRRAVRGCVLDAELGDLSAIENVEALDGVRDAVAASGGAIQSSPTSQAPHSP